MAAWVRCWAAQTNNSSRAAVIDGVDDNVVGGADEQLRDEDALAPTDEYEQTIDDVLNGLSTCSGTDCRSPREGPFVVDMADGDAVVYCRWCYCADVLRIDPWDVGL